MLPSVLPRLSTDSAVRVFPGVWKPLLLQDSLPRTGLCPSFLYLFVFYILSYLLLKTMDCLSGCLMSSASIQKLFCEICSVFKCSFDEFVGEKVVSPSYSSTVLELPLRIIFYKNLIVKSSNNNFIKTQTVESANYSKKMTEAVLRWWRNRTGRPLSPPQIHQKNI